MKPLGSSTKMSLRNFNQRLKSRLKRHSARGQDEPRVSRREQIETNVNRLIKGLKSLRRTRFKRNPRTPQNA